MKNTKYKYLEDRTMNEYEKDLKNALKVHQLRNQIHGEPKKETRKYLIILLLAILILAFFVIKNLRKEELQEKKEELQEKIDDFVVQKAIWFKCGLHLEEKGRELIN